MEILLVLIGLFINTPLPSILYLYPLITKTQFYFWNVFVDSMPASLSRERFIAKY